MKKLTTLLSLLIFIVVLAYALAFAAKNNQALTLDFVLGAQFTWPAALWLGISLVIGGVLGFFSGLVVVAKQKLEIRRLRKELNNAR